MSLYFEEMRRFIEAGYAVKVDKCVDRPRVWFLPHFGVESVNKLRRVRLVFDAAAKTFVVSSNDPLETGPDLLEFLVYVLLHLRKFKYAIKSDMKDMFLRVIIIEEDRRAQRFLGRGKDSTGRPDVYQMTLILCSKSSPSSAFFIKNQNAERFVETKPAAASSSLKNTYMNIYVASRNDRAGAQQRLMRDFFHINVEANFFMNGWASTTREF